MCLQNVYFQELPQEYFYTFNYYVHKREKFNLKIKTIQKENINFPNNH